MSCSFLLVRPFSESLEPYLEKCSPQNSSQLSLECFQKLTNTLVSLPLFLVLPITHGALSPPVHCGDIVAFNLRREHQVSANPGLLRNQSTVCRALGQTPAFSGSGAKLASLVT